MNGDTANKVREEAIYNLGRLFSTRGETDNLKQLFIDTRPFFSRLPKAKTAKIIRKLIEDAASNNAPVALQTEITEDAIKWCKNEKRTFLMQRLQSRLSSLFLDTGKYKEAIALTAQLVRDVKKFDDKLLLVEIHLVESRVHLALHNGPKSKAALTAARSNANSIYCPPLLQAQIDIQAGTLAAFEKDFKTAFSYFYEALEGYHSIGKPEVAVKCLKYMILVKVMMGQLSDAYSLLNGKAGVRHAGVEIEAMRAIVDAYKKRSIHEFDKVYKEYSEQLSTDEIIQAHLTDLKDNLLQENLKRLVEPFSHVEISHVAKLIDLPLSDVLSKLSKMILDKNLNGILDQGSGNLIIFDESGDDATYTAAVETMKELEGVVDRLYNKAKKLQK